MSVFLQDFVVKVKMLVAATYRIYSTGTWILYVDISDMCEF